MTPGAGQALGNGLGGSGGGGGGVDDGPGPISGAVVNGWETALSKRAHPDALSATVVTAHSAITAARVGIPGPMLARLRTAGGCFEFARPSNPRFQPPVDLP